MSNMSNMSDVCIITHYDIVYNICGHLDDKSCLSFLLTCKESPLEQTSVKNVEYEGEKFSKVVLIYGKRIIGHIIFQSYHRRNKFAERFSRAARFISDNDFHMYYLYLDDTYCLLGRYIDTLEYIYPSIHTMFHNIESIDKELSHSRCSSQILDSNRESRITALDDELDEYMAAR